MRYLAILTLCLHLMAPAVSWAQAAKDPLSYPLKQYGFMLATALLGGLVSWYGKVRKGELKGWQISHLIGELATSAFAGLLCFWICQAWGLDLSWTVPLVGISGHMGTKAISAFESYAQRRFSALKGPTQ